MMPIPTLAKTERANDHLVGRYKTRAAARVGYGEIVAELNACEDTDQLEAFLISIEDASLQFKLALSFFWDGDGESFLGLKNEIQAARDRVAENANSRAFG